MGLVDSERLRVFPVLMVHQVEDECHSCTAAYPRFSLTAFKERRLVSYQSRLVCHEVLVFEIAYEPSRIVSGPEQLG